MLGVQPVKLDSTHVLYNINGIFNMCPKGTS